MGRVVSIETAIIYIRRIGNALSDFLGVAANSTMYANVRMLHVSWSTNF